MTIKNIETLTEELVKLLIQFDKDLNGYQTDVYLYYNAETQTATLDTFVNVGGNSWLNDDHYTIYTDKEHFTDCFGDFYQTEEEFADYLDMDFDKLTEEVRKHFDLEEDEKPSFDDYRSYVIANEEYQEKLIAAYQECLENDYHENYEDHAASIMENFFEEIAYLEAMVEY